MPGVGHQRRRRRPSRIRSTSCRRPRALVVLVVADERGRHAVALEQHARAARVLAGDDVRVAQRAQHPQRDVLEVADRRRADDRAGRRVDMALTRGVTRPRRMPAPQHRASRDSAPKRAGTIRTCRCDGDSARAATSLARRLEQQLARRDHAAADDDHLGVEDVDEVGDPDAERTRPDRRDASSAAGSPSCASSVTSAPLISRPAASARPSADPRALAAAARSPRARARSPTPAPPGSRGWGSCPGSAARRRR